MIETPPTPKMSNHALERCKEMGVQAKRAKRIVRFPDQTWESDGGYIAIRSDEPEIAVVYAIEGSVKVIVTVVWRTQDQYHRVPGGFVVLHDEGPAEAEPAPR